MRGMFGSMFDMNRDGKMDAFERAMEFDFLESMEREEKSGRGFDDVDDGDDELMTELELAGIDPEELEYLDSDDRREVLEAAGLDPDEYDF